MLPAEKSSYSRKTVTSPQKLSAALILALTICTTGCLSSLQKHGTALANATAPVVQSAGPTYQEANQVNEMWQDYDAAYSFDLPSTVYNPRNIKPFLTDKDIQTRLAVLNAFQVYVQSVVDITNGVRSSQLDSAAQSAGAGISAVATSLAPTIDAAVSLPAATTSPITPEVTNGISTAANALGQFLVSKKIKRELPAEIIKIDKPVQALCTLLISDLNVIQGQEKRDYDQIINRQTLFLEKNPTLDPAERRTEIMKLPGIVRKEQQDEKQLASLKTAIEKLALTHHAIAADAQGNNPESLRAKLSDLASAGSGLGAYYSSLPTQ
jgi:hypothetical protein